MWRSRRWEQGGTGPLLDQLRDDQRGQHRQDDIHRHTAIQKTIVSLNPSPTTIPTKPTLHSESKLWDRNQKYNFPTNPDSAHAVPRGPRAPLLQIRTRRPTGTEGAPPPRGPRAPLQSKQELLFEKNLLMEIPFADSAGSCTCWLSFCETTKKQIFVANGILHGDVG